MAQPGHREPAVLKISACLKNCCKSLQVTDITLPYDITNNPNGWNAPNVSPDQAVSASLVITLPNGTTISADPTALLAIIQAQDGNSSFSIGSFFPTGTVFPDGILHIVYTVEFITLNISTPVDHYTLTTSIDVPNDCNVSCCVDKMFAKLPHEMCDTCNYQEFMSNALAAEALLMSLRCNASCGNTGQYNKILEQLQKLCQWANCNCGGNVNPNQTHSSHHYGGQGHPHPHVTLGIPVGPGFWLGIDYMGWGWQGT
jgi:hypothetical protein